jgi:isopenicillin-N epimerase
VAGLAGGAGPQGAFHRGARDPGRVHVRLITPADERLSAGIVCFDVEGMRPHAVVQRLRDRRIVATVTPYATMLARLTPSILNTESEIELALEAVRGLT